MKRTIPAALVAGGVLSALVCAAPAAMAAPSDLESGTCQNWSVLDTNMKEIVVKALLTSRPNHRYADQPATVVREVDKGCEVAEKRGAADTVTPAKIIDELNR